MAFTQKNLDLLDKYEMKDVWEHLGVVFSGNTKLIKDQTPKDEYVSPNLAAAVLGLDNTASPTPNTSRYENLWTDIDAQEMFLNAKPTCYLILGKPSLDAYNLGEAISKKYNCIHFCPKSILSDEILQGSLTGKCLDFNMKHNRVCSYKTIFNILEQKLQSAAVKHRGFVLSGFPIVTAIEKPIYLVKTKYSEEAFLSIDELLFDVIYNLKRKKPKSKPAESESTASDRNMEEEDIEEEEEEKEEQAEEAGEEEELIAELPKYFLNTCTDVFYTQKAYYETMHATLLQQLQKIFNLSMKPDIIIYVTCPDADVVIKKQYKYINSKNGQSVIDPFITKIDSDLRWPTHYTLTDYENPHDIHIFNPKYSCRPPSNFKKKAVDQLCNYKLIIAYIEKKIMDYDPKQVIKVDGRTSVYQMMHQISERLLLMHINHVLIPEPLYLQEPPEEFEEFWQMVGDTHTIKSGVLNFRRYPSPWFNRCPVELKQRQSVIGKPKLAVNFFKHVYLLSSLDNFISFCRNPRPFLKQKYLEPTCRIIIIGTRSSGKTMTAHCLSWLFDTPVTCYKKILKVEQDKKYEMYSKTILSEIIATIEDARLLEWERKEEFRLAGLSEWFYYIRSTLQKYVPLLIQSFKYVKKSKSKLKQMKEDKSRIVEQDDEGHDIHKDESRKSSPIIVEEEIPTPDPDFINSLNSLREKLSFLSILDSVEECKTALRNFDLFKESTLLPHAPLELQTRTELPKLPVLGDEDVTKAITEYIVLNDLQKEIEPTPEELVAEIINFISTVDTNHEKETNSEESYGKYIIDGFPSDPVYWELLSDPKLLPDYTIAVMENREIEQELVQHYLDVEKCTKNYYEVISAVKDPLILSKLQTKQLSNVSLQNIQIIMHDLLENCPLIIETEMVPENTEPSPEVIASFTESVEKFQEDWDSIKIKLEEASKCFIEVTLEDKTDVEILEEILLKLRQCYYLKSEPNESDETELEEENTSKDLLSYNVSQNLCETNIYCPFTYFNYGLLWEGKPEFSLKYDNRIYYFAKEDYIELFQNDITKYQTQNKPFKKLPRLKICVTGCIGCGKTTLSKHIAKELGLIHIDFQQFINYNCMPRHYKKVGRNFENPFTEENVEEEAVMEFQLDEENPNLLADILSNEIELRRMINNYFELGQPIIPLFMQTVIKRLWGDPYASIGFVLDGYPRVPQDIEDMVQCSCIPDLVIDLSCDSEVAIQRLGPAMFKKWKSQLKDAKDAHQIKIKNDLDEWMRFIMKRVVVEVILDDILDNLNIEAGQSNQEGFSTQSLIIDADPTGMANVDPKIFKTYNMIVEEYPEPTDTREWQNPADVREEINSRLEAIYEADFENIETIKELVEEQKIKLISIDGTKPFYKVLRLALSKLTQLRNRCQSFLEQTYIVTPDIAEVLLSQGYYFFSKFDRMCPVYIFENPKAMLNSYKISRRKGKLFPVIHRAYIYFVSSEDNVIKFRTNPLKYVSSDKIRSYFPHPLRIGIIGTPKSGKSLLASNLAKRNNLLCISRGMALRSVLGHMHWSDLANKMIKQLHNGETIDTDCVIGAVQTVAIDHRTVTYGFVLDGFPSTPSEAMALAKNGLYPNIIFDISSDKATILENSQNEVYYNILKYKPPYSLSFIENRFTNWSEQCYKIKKWVNNDLQNIRNLNGNESKWQCLQEANNNIALLMTNINYYLANVDIDIVPASAMAISNEIFEQKQSSFRNMCPTCLSKNVYRHSGYPGDKSGVVQYKNKLYWICTEHFDLVLKYPDYYLSKKINIPEVPAVVKTINTDNVYENGICVVTYAENLPRQMFETGTNKYAATYKSKTYLFCGEACLRKFLDKPHLYSDIVVFKGSRWFPRLSLKKLPDLGYLEQTLGNILTEACCSANAIRPKYPGLTFQLSAVIYIALYLKTHNPQLPKVKLDFFLKALRIFESRSKLILDLGLRMRSMENPFLPYPKCYHRVPKKYLPAESLKEKESSDFCRSTSVVFK